MVTISHLNAAFVILWASLRCDESDMQHILVVDDHEPSAQLVSRMLEMSGFATHICSGGQDACDYLRENRDSVWLVVTDWKMPEVDGLFVCQEASHLSIPTILLTAHGQDEDTRIAMSVGATDYLIKPITRSALTSVVQKYQSEGPKV